MFTPAKQEGYHMFARITPWGNSQGLRIPKAFLDLAQMKENDEVELIPQDNAILIRRCTQKKPTLEQLLAEWDGEYSVSDELKEWEQASPIGSELL
ncbi:MAG: AbrB/MazE/SpoVT family DNA-binding domain-containing protein [Clostridiales bacterium]|jgi:antitoxin MazE|nr:AbrB/MazE/SpoVT family DNA-binding domain-containing protein [Clostridiales bacterium]